jgi:hypothetical protein
MVRRMVAVAAAGLFVAGAALAADSLRTVEANGVSLRLTDDWVRVTRAEERATANPHTLLVARELERGYFECYDGRGVAAQLDLQGRTYQLNVMVGDRADRGTITDALAAARSFALAD